MHNWSTDIQKLKKNPEKYNIWKLEQQINFGLCGKKLNTKELKKNLPKMNIDPDRKRFLKLLLNDKKISH